MKRTLIILALIAMVPMVTDDDEQANDLDAPIGYCLTDTECEQREAAIDRQIRLVYEKAARDGWITKERD